MEQNREKKQEKKLTKKEAAVKEIFSWILSFSVALGAALLLKNFVIINADVPTGSMENTIIPGDRLLGNRLAYIKEAPKRGDIVIFRYPDDETQLFVKRVIGLPGEKVEIREGKIYLNDSAEPLEESYLKEEWRVAMGPYTFEVPDDAYLVLGDNRNDSLDARYWTNTYVYRDKILGEAMLVYWPFRDFGKLK